MPVVDVAFVVRAVANGGRAALPVDSSYQILGAVSRLAPALHANEAVGIHPLGGHLGGARDLILREDARLVIRAPHELLPELLPLAGKSLVVGGCRLVLGVPEVRTLVPAPRLYARLVTIKNALDADSLLAGVRVQLAALGVTTGEPGVVRRRAAVPVQGGRGGEGEWVRRTIRVADKHIVGYAVEIGGLSPDDSITVQSKGVGGRRRLGCGIFVPGNEQPS